MGRDLMMGSLPSLAPNPTLSLVGACLLGLRSGPTRMFFRHHHLPPSSWPKQALARAESFLGSRVDSM